METIRSVFLNPKKGIASYSRDILETIATRSSLYNYTSDGVKVLTSSPLDFLPLTNIGERASIILNEELGLKSRESFATTDILSMTSAYNNLHTIYESTLKAPGRAITIETISQQNPIRGVSLLTSDHSICADPPMYPEAIVYFLQSIIPVVAAFKDEDERKKHILQILDLGVGNGEILAAACATPRSVYVGVDTRLPERFVARTTEDAPIRKDSRGLVDLLSLADPQITRRCTVVPEIPVREEMSDRFDIIFIHVDYYTATKGNVLSYMPLLNDTGLIVVYGNPFMEAIWRDLCAIGDVEYGFWGMIGIQNVQKTVTPMMILSKNGVLFDPYTMDLNLFRGGLYGEYMLSYRPGDTKDEDKIRAEVIEYRKKKIPQIVGNLYKAVRIPIEGSINIVGIQENDTQMERFVDLFQLTPDEISKRMEERDKRRADAETTIRLFSYQRGKPVERIITTDKNPNIRLVYTRSRDYTEAYEQYSEYIKKYKGVDIQELKQNIIKHSIFSEIRRLLEKSRQPQPQSQPGSDVAVIVYHRDAFITEIVMSFLAKMKVKVGLLINPESDMGVLSMNTVQKIIEMYPAGVSFFHKIQDAFSTFDEKLKMIINFSTSITPDNFTTPSQSEKYNEIQRTFKIKSIPAQTQNQSATTIAPLPVASGAGAGAGAGEQSPPLTNISEEGGAAAMT